MDRMNESRVEPAWKLTLDSDLIQNILKVTRGRSEKIKRVYMKRCMRGKRDLSESCKVVIDSLCQPHRES